MISVPISLLTKKQLNELGFSMVHVLKKPQLNTEPEQNTSVANYKLFKDELTGQLSLLE